PETQLRQSPQPIAPLDRKALPPLTMQQQQLSLTKPLPPPSRKRGASGSNQVASPNSEATLKPEEKTTKRTLPPAPPAPRRALSSASTSYRQNPERFASLRRELPQPPDH